MTMADAVGGLMSRACSITGQSRLSTQIYNMHLPACKEWTFSFPHTPKAVSISLQTLKSTDAISFALTLPVRPRRGAGMGLCPDGASAVCHRACAGHRVLQAVRVGDW